VLEIGSGSGYQAAILAELVTDVYTIDIVEPLAKTAEATLQRLGYKNVHIKVGDGYQGWPEAAPFDAIIVTCAPENVPQPLVDQLNDGGRLVIPVGERFAQQLYLFEKKNGQLKESVTLPVRFVPMLREKK
jgi:protein-L-isoaspartate(D-aspartate) O-methyltransferase